MKTKVTAKRQMSKETQNKTKSENSFCCLFVFCFSARLFYAILFFCIYFSLSTCSFILLQKIKTPARRHAKNKNFTLIHSQQIATSAAERRHSLQIKFDKTKEKNIKNRIHSKRAEKQNTNTKAKAKNKTQIRKHEQRKNYLNPFTTNGNFCSRKTTLTQIKFNKTKEKISKTESTQTRRKPKTTNKQKQEDMQKNKNFTLIHSQQIATSAAERRHSLKLSSIKRKGSKSEFEKCGFIVVVVAAAVVVVVVVAAAVVVEVEDEDKKW